jgi:hypothetical protein
MANVDLKYETITRPSVIRLMSLQPGCPTDPIHITLDLVSLNASPTYEAISYCWGDAHDKEEIVCGDASLFITRSLSSALVSFRYEDRPRILWADAICINQADLVEKGRQVLLMPRIYSGAARVLVWLGDDEAGLQNVRESIGRALAFLPPDTHDAIELARQSQTLLSDAMERRRKGQPNLLDHDWRPLWRLLGRPWFRRKWIVQEVVHAKEVMVHAGSIEVPWIELATFTFKIESLGLVGIVIRGELDREDKEERRIDNGQAEERPQQAWRDIVIKPMHSVTVIHLAAHYRATGTLLDCVVATASFFCTEERDHVYALLSLPVNIPNIQPDYTRTLENTFRLFAVRELEEMKSLKVLGLAPDKLAFSRPGKERLALPSWVPDLRLIGEIDPLMSYTIREQQFYAGGHAEPVISISKDQRILRCHGRVFDSIKLLVPSVLDMLVSDKPQLLSSEVNSLSIGSATKDSMKRFGTWVQSCYNLANKTLDAFPEAAELRTAFWRTMLCDMTNMRDRAPEALINGVAEYLEISMAMVTGTDVCIPNISPEFQKVFITIDQTVSVCTAGRRFCVTNGGRFGFLPPGAVAGDQVCVLLGGEVPFVVRRTEHDTYRLIGECYIHGVMYGEVMEDVTHVTTEIQLE